MTTLTKQPLSLFHFDTDLLDTSGKVWTTTNSPVVSAEQSVFGGSSCKFTNSYFQYANTLIDTSKDFTVSYREYLLSLTGSGALALSSNAKSNQGILLGYNGTTFYASTSGGGWDIIYTMATSAEVLNKWVHWELTYVASSKTLRLFKDGILKNTWTLANHFPMVNNNWFGWWKGVARNGYMDEVLITQECLHTTNFTPPTSAYEVSLPYWLAKTKNIPSYWSYKTNSWVDVGLPTTDADIATLFVNQGTNTCPTQQQLELLGTGVNRPNRCCYQSVVTTQPTININAIPTGKTVKPVELLPISSIEGIDSVSIFNTITVGTVKLAVTLDLVTYYKFNGSAWEVIDINTNQNNMMDIATVTNINRSQWDLLTNGTASGIAFAYYFDISGIGDVVKIDKTSLVVDMRGEWSSAIKGSDFKYGYPVNDKLKVTLLNSGDYKINYSL